MGIEAKWVKQASRIADARKIRLGEDRFCELGIKLPIPAYPICRFCRPIAVLLAKKAVKYGPPRRICSRFIISQTGS
ncbi:MAG: hypothetical protein AUK53_02500 [Betaproteobacteria bacterium CG2_30_59_46]|nr:MAG: hypothetical protein AUK53_02500 [Betaproteobacteria bacterium CG2_30_59_46]PIQ12571.1 MAG: hypothetical protein COW70_09320 [Hydrogenophilales bacterium CG18_big_fil_WC_8_21_14_2_50_58_12]PIX98764.1 MAG: hypothetical protein COZ23_13095 [Hydrogenophilales bacterium CG_4_10_14_3_um_filter_58_23]PJB04945.1 MAG: hypothetical protein CO125_10275 [Hydrogenophilales bacterium CG_4_9_14_3_um_filter_59_35]